MDNSRILKIKPIDQTPTDEESSKPIKRPSSQKATSPKKKPLILTKRPIILPKVQPNTANTITLHGVNGTKSIPTISIPSTFVAVPENGKKFISFFATDVKKLSLVNCSNKAPINSKFTQNDASKTTGT